MIIIKINLVENSINYSKKNFDFIFHIVGEILKIGPIDNKNFELT